MKSLSKVGILVNKTNVNIGIVKRNGGAFMLSPKAKVKGINLADLKDLPKGVIFVENK